MSSVQTATIGATWCPGRGSAAHSRRIGMCVSRRAAGYYSGLTEEADVIWELIDRSSAAWLSGRPADTAELFHPDARLVAPGLVAVVEGREGIVQTYVDTTATMAIDHFDVTRRSLLGDGDLAVATYVFAISCRADGMQHQERGQEAIVLRSADRAWKAI